MNDFAPDGLVARQSGGTWVYYLFDQQGSVAARTDASGPLKLGRGELLSK